MGFIKEKCVFCGNEIAQGCFCINTGKGWAHNSCIPAGHEVLNGGEIKDCEDSRVWNVLNLMVEGFVNTRNGFAPKVAEALREYADAIDNGTGAMDNPEVFEASNDCTIKIIAGQLLSNYFN